MTRSCRTAHSPTGRPHRRRSIWPRPPGPDGPNLLEASNDALGGQLPRYSASSLRGKRTAGSGLSEFERGSASCISRSASTPPTDAPGARPTASRRRCCSSSSSGRSSCTTSTRSRRNAPSPVPTPGSSRATSCSAGTASTRPASGRSSGPPPSSSRRSKSRDGSPRPRGRNAASTCSTAFEGGEAMSPRERRIPHTVR